MRLLVTAALLLSTALLSIAGLGSAGVPGAGTVGVRALSTAPAAAVATSVGSAGPTAGRAGSTAGRAGPIAGPAGPIAGRAGHTAGRPGHTAGPAAGDYLPPITGALRVLRGFSPPATAYGPGHLGVDLTATTGVRILAAGVGVVRFAGLVAGRGVVVIGHPDGVSTEYEPVTPTVAVGAPVVAGQPIGRLTGRHRGCPATGCLHWGAHRNGRYLDPMSLLQPLGIVRLLPWDWLAPG